MDKDGEEEIVHYGSYYKPRAMTSPKLQISGQADFDSNNLSCTVLCAWTPLDLE